MEEQAAPEPEVSDAALVARVCQRDVSAFALLYDRYARPVYVLAAHMLGGAEAEEVVQEVFLRLWNKADQFQAGRGSFRAWFMSIARHHVLDQLRRLGHEQRLMAAEAVDRALAEAPDGAAGVEETVWDHERSEAVLRALKRLPADQRRALVLAYFGGLSQASIAQRLGWPLGTVKKRIQLGLQKLRASMAAEYGNALLATDGDNRRAEESQAGVVHTGAE